MDRAIESFRNGDAGLNEVAKMYNTPKATLKRHLENKNKYANGNKKYSGRPTALPAALEAVLVQHCLELEAMTIGLTRQDLMQLAYQLASINKLEHSFNPEKNPANKHWFYDFMRRHRQLVLRQSEATSTARANGFNRTSVGEYFDKLTALIDKHSFDALHIFNMDESGITTVQKPGKVIGRRGKQQVGSLTSGERGFTMTVVCCFSASGSYAPPMIIFKRKRLPEELKLGAPPGSEICCNDSGWMTKELFLRLVKHFQHSVKCTLKEPVLLILDGHVSHSKNLEAIIFARENGIVMLSLPPHTTHRLLPLDRTFYKPLMVYYNQACDMWIRTERRNVAVFQISRLF